MSLIDLEKTKLKEWTEQQSSMWPQSQDQQQNSYFSASAQNAHIYEFNFDNIPQLKTLLENRKKVVHDSKVDMVCAVAAFKYRNTVVTPEAIKKDDADDTNVIPDFIYNF